MTKDAQFRQRAMKNWDPSDPHDWKEKIRIQDILRAKWNYKCTFDRTIFIDKATFEVHLWQPSGCLSREEVWNNYYIHVPDIFISTQSGYKIVEIDGSIHFNSQKGVKNTNLRNEHYQYAGINLCWLTADFVNEANTEEIIERIEDQCWL